MNTTNPGLAAYQRVAELIREEIRTGTLPVNAKLPGNRGIAEKYGVALGTAQKALGLLQDEGWLVTTPSVGVFVNEPPKGDVAQGVQGQLDELRSTVTDLAERLRRLEQAAGESS
ncbi:GntR family transcriptional regulator [Umezawaea endophytica]|uniref:GntR family transcriptional regulator n=1 Tax=Umezawaea endophytica TaxID=1654476 RepID=UPI0035EAB337